MRVLKIGATVLAILAAMTDARAARAAGPEPAPPPPDQARGWETPPGTTPEEAALAGPQVALMAPRLVLTVTFLPIEGGLRVVSRRIAKGGGDAGEEDDVRTVAILPHLSYLTGFGTTVGIAARLQNLGGHGEEAAVTAGFGGRFAQFVETSFLADRAAGSQTWVESRARYEIRPQEIFRGIGDGTGTAPSPESRFRERRLTVLERAGVTMGEPGRLTKIGGAAIFQSSSFGPKDDDFSADPSIETAYDARALRGFAGGARTVEFQGNLVVDTRDALAATSRGLHAAAYAGVVPALDHYGFGHVGLDVTGYVDLYKKTRVLVLRGAVEGVLGEDGDIPFTQLARLGGPEQLRGYRLDRYRDRESALVSAEYRYPIHHVVAGALFVDAGHVAHDPEALTALSRWCAGAGVGLRIRTTDTTIASLDLAYGDGVQLFFSIFPFDSRAQWNKR